MNRRHTIFVLKPDALERGITGEVLTAIREHYDILCMREMSLTREDVYALKREEWATGWQTPPTEEVIELIYQYEASTSLAVLCKIRGAANAIAFGRELKGTRHLAHECAPDSIRGRFFDRVEAENTRLYYGNVSMVFDGDRLLSLPRNIIHSVDTDDELIDLLNRAFDGDRSLLGENSA